MYSLVEYFQVGIRIKRTAGIENSFRRELGVVLQLVAAERTRKLLMAQCRQLGIVDKSINFQPPRTDKRSNKRSYQSANVDKHIEDLKPGVSRLFCDFQSLRSFLGFLSLKVVVHLSHNSLQIALKQTITKGNHQQGKASQRQQP